MLRAMVPVVEEVGGKETCDHERRRRQWGRLVSRERWEGSRADPDRDSGKTQELEDKHVREISQSPRPPLPFLGGYGKLDPRADEQDSEHDDGRHGIALQQPSPAIEPLLHPALPLAQTRSDAA